MDEIEVKEGMEDNVAAGNDGSAVDAGPSDADMPGQDVASAAASEDLPGQDVASAAASADMPALARDIEAVIFISPEPVSLEVLAEVTGAHGEDLSRAVEAVRAKYSGRDGAIVFSEVAGGYTFRTGDRAREAVERFCARPVDYTLSAAAMESLAIIAYLQPIARPEIARIRGVGADTVVANLLDKGLVEEAGRDKKTGAVKYRTTQAFEKLFGLAGLDELPLLEGFEATAQDVEELRQKLYLAAEKRQ